MTDLLPVLTAYFSKQQWPHGPSTDPRGIEVRHGVASPPYRSCAHQLAGGPIFVYDSFPPEPAGPERRAEVAQFVARVNYELIVGTFSLDWDTGIVRLRSAVDLRGQPLTEALIDGVVLSHHQAMIDWLAHLIGVMQGEHTAHEAFTEAVEQLG